MKKLGLLLVSCACSLFIWQNAGAAPAAGKAVAAKKKVQLLGFEPKSCKKIIVQGDSVTVCVETSKPDVVLDREAKYQIQRAASLLAETAAGAGIQKIISNDGLSFSCNNPNTDPCADPAMAMGNPMCPGYDPCMANPSDPMCPGNNPPPDPCAGSAAMMNPMCPGYNPCYMNPSDPMCPGNNPPPPDPCAGSAAMMNPMCPGFNPCYMNPSAPGCPGYNPPPDPCAGSAAMMNPMCPGFNPCYMNPSDPMCH